MLLVDGYVCVFYIGKTPWEVPFAHLKITTYIILCKIKWALTFLYELKILKHESFIKILLHICNLLFQGKEVFGVSGSDVVSYVLILYM